MKETGILFKSDMVTAILEGRKNQTRRICNPQPTKQWAVEKYCSHGPGSVDASDLTNADMEIDHLLEKCHYGQKGDLLYVKETWAELYDICDHPELQRGYTERWSLGFKFKADGYVHNQSDGFWNGWKSPLFLRKEDARIWLRNTGVRVERLQEITQEDARGEGILPAPHRPASERCKPHSDDSISRDCYVCAFKTLWNRINGGLGFGWDINPYVFVIDFEILSLTGRPKNV